MQSSKGFVVKRIIGLFVGLYCAVSAVDAGAVQLMSSANVSVASDTATNAKNIAMDEARRQVIVDCLLPYSDNSGLRGAVKSEKSSVLMNLISSSEIANEKLSDTTYSARVTMSVNNVAAKNWLDSRGVQNWIPVGTVSTNNFTLAVNLSNKISDWASVRRAAIGAGIDLNTKYIEGNKIVFAAPSSKRGAITIALRDNGWRYQDIDGVLTLSR